MRLIFFDTDPDVIAAYEAEIHTAFPKSVEIICDDIKRVWSNKYDAIVSPANSWGEMGGGIDKVIMGLAGSNLETTLMNDIADNHMGELLLGTATIIPIGKPDAPRYLIASPTMRLPGDCSETINAYLSMTGMLRAVKLWNNSHPDCDKIKTVLIPGLCTGVGGMPPKRSAYQIWVALKAFVKSGPIYKLRKGANHPHQEARTLWRTMAMY